MNPDAIDRMLRKYAKKDWSGERVFGAFDARDVYNHGAGERRAARRRAEAAGHRDPNTTKLYDRRGYNPEKAASFFATY